MSNFQFSRPDNFPPVVKNLLIINCLVFVAQIIFMTKGVDLAEYGGLWNWRFSREQYEQAHLFGFRPFQFFTHMFMHQVKNEHNQFVLMHILFNMFMLWMFGRIMEVRMGSKKFLLLYIISGLGAALVQELVGNFYSVIGASGAVMGVLAAFGYLFPNTEVQLLFIPIPVKVKYMIPVIIALDVFGGISRVQGDNVAHWAHLGGALTGFLLVLFWNKTDRRSFY